VWKTIKLKWLLQFENNCQIMQIPSDCLEYFSTGPHPEFSHANKVNKLQTLLPHRNTQNPPVETWVGGGQNCSKIYGDASSVSGGDGKKFWECVASFPGVVNCKKTAICIKIHWFGGKLTKKVGTQSAKRIILAITKC